MIYCPVTESMGELDPLLDSLMQDSQMCEDRRDSGIHWSRVIGVGLVAANNRVGSEEMGTVVLDG